MGTHTSRTFLNSCLKVPLDPCNRCPAPIYNRPKIYLGKMATTVSTLTPLYMDTRETATTIKVQDDYTYGIRSLVSLYDSIPDYGDINHLTGDDFYSTLDTLRTTCRQLSCQHSPSLHNVKIGIKENFRNSSKKKSTTLDKSNTKKLSSKDSIENTQDLVCLTTPYTTESKLNFNNLKSPRDELKNDIETFKKSLQDFEDELTRIEYSDQQSKKSTAKISTKLLDNIGSAKITNNPTNYSQKLPRKTPSSSQARKLLKKSYSFNDLYAVSDDCRNDKNATQQNILSKAECLAFKDRTKLSNYFMPTYSETDESRQSKRDLPAIVINSPSTESSKSNNVNAVKKKKSKNKKCNDLIKVPFTFFKLSDEIKDSIERKVYTPIHPVARPNLAANLRAEVSKKKIKELQNNCTFYDSTPQFDWEVRKTPAWKSLSINESHKKILSYRLATRKVEQDLQKREYELNMELMRQRVKSAPLLLEGTTYWGPNVGKLSHTCPTEGIQHMCQKNQRKNHKKNSGKCKLRNSSECEIGSQMSSKMNTLRKIYTSNGKSYSRHSHHSKIVSTQRSNKQRSRAGHTETEHEECGDVIGSGDEELSSMDRAYL